MLCWNYVQIQYFCMRKHKTCYFSHFLVLWDCRVRQFYSSTRGWGVRDMSHLPLSLVDSVMPYLLFSNILCISFPISLLITGPRQANLVLIVYASSEGSGEPAHPRSLARTFAARSYKQWVKRNLQTESQIPDPSEWLGMRSWNLSWRNARRHKFAWRGPTVLS